MHSLRYTPWAFACLFLVAASTPADIYRFEQGVNGYTGFRDTTLFEDLTENAGGGIDGIFTGTIRTGFLRRALIAADLSEIPADAVVVSARLELVVERSGGNFGNIAFGLHRILRDWGEGTAFIPGDPGGFGAPAVAGDATWNDAFFTQTPWTAPGGDFVSTPSATANAGQQGALTIWEGPGLTADVQGWIAAPETNFGWEIITPDEGIIQRVKKFFSSEALVNRPVLIVETEDPATPPGGNGLLLGLVIFWLLRLWFRIFRIEMG